MIKLFCLRITLCLPENSNPSGHVPVSASHLQARLLLENWKSKSEPGAMTHFLLSLPHTQKHCSGVVPGRANDWQFAINDKINVVLNKKLRIF